MAILSKYVRYKREEKFRPYIKEKVLDIGCGHSGTIQYLNPKNYYATEYLKSFVESLKHHFPKAHFYRKDFEKDTLKLPVKVDSVIMSAFLEHISNYENPIKESLKNLKDDGRIIITTPSRFGHKVHAIGANLGLFSKEAKEDHKSILTKKDFMRIAIKYNLKMEKFEYFEFFCNQLVVYKK